MGFALCIQISALSWILSTKYGLKEGDVGLVWAAGPLAGIFGQLIIGFISDKVWFWGGRRRPFIWIGGVIAGLMLFLLPRLDGVADMLGIASIIPVAAFVALALDLAINIGFNPTRSIIADVTPEGQQRTKGYTWMQTISGGFGVAAYFIGAIWNNYALIWTGIILVPLFTLIPPLFIKEPREQTQSSDQSQSPKTTQTGQIARIFIAHAFTWLGVQTMFVYIFFYIKDKFGLPGNDEIGQVIAWAFLVLNVVGFILPALVLEPLSRKIGRVRVHLACMAVMALGYLGIALAGSGPVLLYVLMAVVGIGWAAVVSLPFAILADKVEQSKMGTFMGIFNLSVVLPQLVVSFVVGGLVETMTDKSGIFWICAGSLAISALLWGLVREKE
ncbi:MAG: MFS transporter [Bacteroidia bacterium]|nr:MFS transporter [Bacteroidia bacterium]